MAISIGNMMMKHQFFWVCDFFRQIRRAKGACASQSHLQSCRPPRHIAWPDESCSESSGAGGMDILRPWQWMRSFKNRQAPKAPKLQPKQHESPLPIFPSISRPTISIQWYYHVLPPTSAHISSSEVTSIRNFPEISATVTQRGSCFILGGSKSTSR